MHSGGPDPQHLGYHWCTTTVLPLSPRPSQFDSVVSSLKPSQSNSVASESTLNRDRVGFVSVETKLDQSLPRASRLLEEAKGRWVDKLPQELWSYHTIPHSMTNKTLFRLTFGIKAMIPVEIREPSPRIALFELGRNEEELRTNLDLLQEIREIAHVREYAIRARAARRYDRGVIPHKFEPGDLVLRKVTHKTETNKLTPMCEDPFKILEEVGRGAYHLEHLDGKKVPHTWNAASLRIRSSDKPDNGQLERSAWGHEEVISPITDNRKGQPGGMKK
ncbi:hypothetical protein CR513_60071, partial [Mucuna pruriens]